MKSAGYSLFELVVVLVISAILAAFAIPCMQRSAIDASWFSEEVRAAVRQAQRQAVAQRRLVYVKVSADKLELCYGVPTPGNCPSPLTNPSTGAAYVVAAPSGVALSGPASFWFNGLGQPSGAVTVSVGGQPVAVAAETGYVQ